MPWEGTSTGFSWKGGGKTGGGGTNIQSGSGGGSSNNNNQNDLGVSKINGKEIVAIETETPRWVFGKGGNEMVRNPQTGRVEKAFLGVGAVGQEQKVSIQQYQKFDLKYKEKQTGAVVTAKDVEAGRNMQDFRSSEAGGSPYTLFERHKTGYVVDRQGYMDTGNIVGNRAVGMTQGYQYGQGLQQLDSKETKQFQRQQQMGQFNETRQSINKNNIKTPITPFSFFLDENFGQSIDPTIEKEILTQGTLTEAEEETPWITFKDPGRTFNSGIKINTEKLREGESKTNKSLIKRSIAGGFEAFNAIINPQETAVNLGTSVFLAGAYLFAPNTKLGILGSEQIIDPIQSNPEGFIAETLGSAVVSYGIAKGYSKLTTPTETYSPIKINYKAQKAVSFKLYDTEANIPLSKLRMSDIELTGTRTLTTPLRKFLKAEPIQTADFLIQKTPENIILKTEVITKGKGFGSIPEKIFISDVQIPNQNFATRFFTENGMTEQFKINKISYKNNPITIKKSSMQINMKPATLIETPEGTTLEQAKAIKIKQKLMGRINKGYKSTDYWDINLDKTFSTSSIDKVGKSKAVSFERITKIINGNADEFNTAKGYIEEPVKIKLGNKRSGIPKYQTTQKTTILEDTFELRQTKPPLQEVFIPEKTFVSSADVTNRVNPALKTSIYETTEIEGTMVLSKLKDFAKAERNLNFKNNILQQVQNMKVTQAAFEKGQKPGPFSGGMMLEELGTELEQIQNANRFGFNLEKAKILGKNNWFKKIERENYPLIEIETEYVGKMPNKGKNNLVSVTSKELKVTKADLNLNNLNKKDPIILNLPTGAITKLKTFQPGKGFALLSLQNIKKEYKTNQINNILPIIKNDNKLTQQTNEVIQLTDVYNIVSTKLATATTTTTITETKVDTTQDTATTTQTTKTPTIITPKIIPNIKIPTIIPIFSFSKSDKQPFKFSKGGYFVVMREFGKEVKVNAKPLSKMKAESLGRDITKQSISASFKIVPQYQTNLPQATRIKWASGGWVDPFRFGEGKSSKLKGFSVEKLGMRIGGPGAKIELKQAKKRKGLRLF